MLVFEAVRVGGGYRVGLALTREDAQALIDEVSDVHEVRGPLDLDVVFLIIHDPAGYDREVSTEAVYRTHEGALAAQESGDAIELVELKP